LQADHFNTLRESCETLISTFTSPPETFDAVSAELSRTLDHFDVPGREKEEVLEAFNGWKDEVTAGSQAEAINWRRWR